MRQFLLLTFSVLFLFSSYTFGATVSKVKGKGVLIKNPSTQLKVGDLYYLITPDGKKTGIIRIKKAENGRSIGKLLKGKARPNLELLKRKTKSKKSSVARKKSRKKKKSSAPPPKRISKKSKKSKKSKQGFMQRIFSGDKNKAVGLAAGFSSNSSDVTFVDSGGNQIRQDSYSGTSLSFELFFDYQLFNKLYLRASLGQQNFEAGDEENDQCIGSNGAVGAECIVDLSYINLDFWLHYYFMRGKRFEAWGGAGVGFLLSPDAGTTTALDPDDVATTAFFQFGAGGNFLINEKFYIPFWAEYGLYPSSDTVDMSSISVYAGIGYRL